MISWMKSLRKLIIFRNKAHLNPILSAWSLLYNYEIDNVKDTEEPQEYGKENDRLKTNIPRRRKPTTLHAN
jgi:hypothetical protein